MQSLVSSTYLFLKKALHIFVVALLWSFLAQIIPFVLISIGIDVTSSYSGMLISLVGEFIGIFAMYIYYRNTSYVLPPLKKNTLQHYLLGFSSGSLTFVFIWTIIYALGGYYIEITFHLINILWLLAFLLGFAIQSFFEELLCRGLIMGYWLKDGKVISAFFLNSIIFTFFHIGNPGFDIYAAAGLFMFALLMSEIRFISGNIWICSAFHAAWNFLEGSVLGTSVSGLPNIGLVIKSINTTSTQRLTGGAFGVERSSSAIIVYGLLVTIIFILLVLKRKDNFPLFRTK